MPSAIENLNSEWRVKMFGKAKEVEAWAIPSNLANKVKKTMCLQQGNEYFHPYMGYWLNNIRSTKEEAEKDAQDMRLDKIRRMEKQLAKLRKAAGLISG